MTTEGPSADDELSLDAETIRNLVSWAWGSVTPQALARFNVHEAWAGAGCSVSFMDELFVLRFGPGLEPGSDSPPESVIEPILGAYALLEGIAFDWNFLGGMDLKGGSWDSVGYFKWVGRHQTFDTAPDGPGSIAMIRAIRVAEAARGVPGYRLALRDVLATVRDPGDDRFVFAHRAVADLARAATGSGDVEWSALHYRLSTTEEAFRERLGPLQDARDAAAHGDDQDPALVLARRRRDVLVKLARQIVVEAMVADERMPLDAETRI